MWGWTVVRPVSKSVSFLQMDAMVEGSWHAPAFATCSQVWSPRRVSDTPIPVLDTPRREFDTPAPVLDTPRRVFDTPAPVVDTRHGRGVVARPRLRYLHSGLRFRRQEHICWWFCPRVHEFARLKSTN